MADFVPDGGGGMAVLGGVKNQLSSIESTINRIGQAAPTEQIERFSDNLYDLQKSTGMSYSEIKKFNKELGNTSSAIRQYSLPSLLALQKEIRTTTTAHVMLGKKMGDFTKLMTTAFPQGVEKSSRVLLQLQARMPRLFDKIRQGSDDIGTLAEVQAKGGEEARRIYQKLVDTVRDPRAQQNINELSLATDRLGVTAENAKMAVSGWFRSGYQYISSLSAQESVLGDTTKAIAGFSGGLKVFLPALGSAQSLLFTFGALKYAGAAAAYKGAKALGVRGIAGKVAEGVAGSVVAKGALVVGGGVAAASTITGGADYLRRKVVGGPRKYTTMEAYQIMAGRGVSTEYKDLKAAGQFRGGEDESVGKKAAEAARLQKEINRYETISVRLTGVDKAKALEKVNKLREKQIGLENDIINAASAYTSLIDRDESIITELNRGLEAQGGLIDAATTSYDKSYKLREKMIKADEAILKRRIKVLKTLKSEGATSKNNAQIAKMESDIASKSLDVYNRKISAAKQLYDANKGLRDIENERLDIQRKIGALYNETAANVEKFLKKQIALSQKNIKAAKKAIKDEQDAQRGAMPALRSASEGRLQGFETQKSALDLEKRRRPFSERQISDYTSSSNAITSDAGRAAAEQHAAVLSGKMRQSAQADQDRRKKILGGKGHVDSDAEANLDRLEIRLAPAQQKVFDEYRTIVKSIEGYDKIHKFQERKKQFAKEYPALIQKIASEEEKLANITTLKQTKSIRDQNIIIENEQASIKLNKASLEPQEAAIANENKYIEIVKARGEFVRSTYKDQADYEKKMKNFLEDEVVARKNIEIHVKKKEDRIRGELAKAKPEDRAGIQLELKKALGEKDTARQATYDAEFTQKTAGHDVAMAQLELLGQSVQIQRSTYELDKTTPPKIIADEIRKQRMVSEDSRDRAIAIRDVERQRYKEGKISAEQMLLHEQKVLTATEKVAQFQDQYRRTWEEKFTKFTMGMTSGTYLYGGETSGMAQKGPAFTPWGGERTKGWGTRTAMAMRAYGVEKYSSGGEQEIAELLKEIDSTLKKGKNSPGPSVR